MLSDISTHGTTLQLDILRYRIEAVEVKFNDSGNPPQMLPQIKQYSAMFGESWLIEVSNLSPTTEAFLQRHGGVRFDHNLYP
jgi:hypothetical protein